MYRRLAFHSITSIFVVILFLSACGQREGVMPVPPTPGGETPAGTTIAVRPTQEAVDLPARVGELSSPTIAAAPPSVTAPPPTIRLREPRYLMQKERTLTIRLRFDQPMDRASVAAALRVEPAIPLALSWDGSDLLLEPEEPFGLDTRYSFTVTNAAQSAGGVPLKSNYTFAYKFPPLLQKVTYPVDIGRDTPIVWQFNYAMDPVSVRRALVIEPPIVGDLEWDDGRVIATFTPAVRLPASTQFTVQFDGPLRDAGGNEMPAPDPDRFTSAPPILAVSPAGSRNHPAQSITIRFDRPMDEAKTTAALRITPAVDGTISWQETTLTFTPDEYFATHTDYTVRLGLDAADAAGDPILLEPYEWRFGTGSLSSLASFGWGPNAQVLDVDGRRAIQYQAFQVAPVDLDFELYSVTLEQFLDRYSSGFRGVAGSEQRPISTEDATLFTSWRVQTARGTNDYNNVQELIVPADVPPGLYILNLRSGYLNDQLLLILTANTLTIKQAEKQLVTWVTGINGVARPGVEVAVYARDGELLQSGVSDDNGIFRTAVETDPQPLIVIARDGEDITAAGLNYEFRSQGSYWYSWWDVRPVPEQYASYIITDRPIYQPGQTLFFKAIIRQDNDAVLELLPAGTAVTVRIRDARNNIVQTFPLTSNDFGTVQGVFNLADGAMLGDYHVELQVAGSATSKRQLFKVQDYRKPDYEVTVTTNADRYVAGETIQVTADSRYFFGEPVANADLVVSRLALGYSGQWIQSYENPIRARTDDDGRFSFTLDAGTWGYGQTDWRRNLERTSSVIEVTVDDGSHQTVSSHARVEVFNTAEYIDLEMGGYVQEPGRPFTLRAAVQDLFDEPVAGRRLTVELRRYSYQTHQYNIIVQDARLMTGSDGWAQTDFTIVEPGYYEVRLHGSDRLGNPIEYNSWVYAFSDFYSGWYGRGSQISITADRAEYAAGETARLLIESAFSGPALLTFERGTVRREQLVQLTAPLTIVEVPIQAEDTPNIFVAINAWQEQDTTLPEDGELWESLADSRLHTARTELLVPVTDKSLSITITADKSSYAPGQEATFTVQVTNGRGEPVSAELSLAMVDEAIFALSAELSGPIFDAFYYPRSNTVQTFDSLALQRYLGGGRGGGGGGDDSGIGNPRQEFPDTAAWFPQLMTDSNGQAIVRVTMPDSLTSWRLTAKATTADTQVGEITANVITRQDIVVRPILPRILTAGDSVQLSALVHNYSTVRQTVTVTLETDQDPALLQATAESPRRISLAAGEVRIVGWTVTAVAAGEANVIVRAANVTATGPSDAVLLTLPIRPLAVPDVTTEIGQFGDELATSIIMPPDALSLSGARIELSRSIAGSLLQGLDYLTGFPYGCVEQTMSRALPNAVVGRALFQLGITDPGLQADLPPMIQASIQRLYGYQHNDGGWGWWFDDASDHYQTAWVVFGLAVTAEAGYEIDPAVLERGVAWLDEQLSWMDPQTKAFALYSMALAGQPNVEATETLAAEPEQLDTFSQAALALTLHELGRQTAARRLVDRLADTAVVVNGQVHWSGAGADGQYQSKIMASDTRTTALVLSALSRISPAHSLEAGTVRWLLGRRTQSGWGTTNETSFAILGLTDHLLATDFNEAAGSTTYQVTLNGEVVASGNLGRGAPAVTLEIPAGDMAAGANELRITQSGSRRLYYVISNRVYLAQAEIAAAGGLTVSRSYLNPATGRPLTRVTAGQLVKVKLTLNMPTRASYMLLEDNLPGGLEALNESLNNSSYGTGQTWEEPNGWRSYGYNNKEVHGDRVTFFITEMAPGRHTFTYMARATHSGTFVALPAEAYAMYDLSLWGRSASARLVIND